MITKLVESIWSVYFKVRKLDSYMPFTTAAVVIPTVVIPTVVFAAVVIAAVVIAAVFTSAVVIVTVVISAVVIVCVVSVEAETDDRLIRAWLLSSFAS